MEIESLARRQLACLGDASRFRIVTELTSGEACVTELAGRIGLSQSCTTRHLQALERAGLVTRERAGRRVLFAVRSQDPAVRSLLDWKSRLETDADLAMPGAGARGAGPGAVRRGRARRPGGEDRGRDASRPRGRPTSPPSAPPVASERAGSGPGHDGAPSPDDARASVPAPARGQAQPEGGGDAGQPAETPETADLARVPEPARPFRRAYEDLEDFLL